MENELKNESWNVLVVDDIESVHIQTKFALQTLWFDKKKLNILHAKSSGEAISIFDSLSKENQTPAVLLLDIVMENNEPTGFDVVTHIRETKKNNCTQIIIRTGQAGKEIAEETSIATEFDVNGVLKKGEDTRLILRTSVLTGIKVFQLKCREKEYLRQLEEKNIELENSKHDLMSFFLLSQKKYQEKMYVSVDGKNIESVVKTLIQSFSNQTDKHEAFIESDALDFVLSYEKQELNDIRVLFNVIDYCFTKLNDTCKIDLELMKRAVSQAIDNMTSIMIWNSDDNELLELYKALCGEDVNDYKANISFIEKINFEDFKYHFSKSIIKDEKINWIQTREDFIHLFIQLAEVQNCFDNNFRSKMFAELARHFTIDGKEISSRALSTIKSNNIVDGDWIDENRNAASIYEIVRNIF